MGPIYACERQPERRVVRSLHLYVGANIRRENAPVRPDVPRTYMSDSAILREIEELNSSDEFHRYSAYQLSALCCSACVANGHQCGCKKQKPTPTELERAVYPLGHLYPLGELHRYRWIGRRAHEILMFRASSVSFCVALCSRLPGSFFLLPECLNFICFCLVGFPTKNDENQKV